MPDGLVIVGRIARAHGIRGEVVVELLTDEPDAIFASGRRLVMSDARGDIPAERDEVTIAGARVFGKAMLVTLDGIRDRSAAEQLRGRVLLVPRSAISEPDEGEVFMHELEGMQVVSPEGELYGSVAAWYELPHGLLLEVRFKDGSTRLLPFRSEIVVAVDRDGRALTVIPPEGLF